MRHGQAASCRTNLVSQSDVSGWLNAGTAKGCLGLQLQAFLEQCSVGCLASDTPAAQKSLFLTENCVFWAVTPKLKKSLLADRRTCTSAAKHAIA